MICTADLLQVLYSPARWADPAWFDLHQVDRRWPVRLSNRILLRRASLGGLDVPACQCPRAQWLIAHWHELPALVYLAGARMVRDAIGSRNGVTCLRHDAAGFLSLPIGMPSELCVAATALTSRVAGVHDIAMAEGARCIARSMQGLPAGWQDRIRLRLPPTHADLLSRNDQHRSSAQPHYCKATFNLLKFAASFYRAQDNRDTSAPVRRG